MIPYWLMFSVAAVAALGERWTVQSAHRQGIFWLLAGIALAIMIGFRYEVGGDWSTYLEYLERSSEMTFLETFRQQEPSYILVNWLASQAGLDIWAVNLVCGAVFASGLVAFAREQPRPWLAMLVAVPYLILVVAMGYSRQGVAIGLSMIGLVSLKRGSTLGFLFWLFLGATFHKTALIMIPLATLSTARNFAWKAFCVGLVGVAFYYFILADSVSELITNYLEAEYDSQGAAIRVLMNALPAGYFLLRRGDFNLGWTEKRLWTFMSVGAIALIGLLILSPSSTAVDRIALYFIPIQLFVFSRLPAALGRRIGSQRTIVHVIVAYCAAVQFVWLTFAQTAFAWLPYQLYPI